VIISGGIDLAPGAIIALTTVVVGYLFVEAGWPLGAGAAAGLVVGAAAGLLSSWLVVRVRLPPFIATLGVMGILRGNGVHRDRSQVLRPLRKAAAGLARRGRVDRLARADRDDRTRDRLPAPDDRLPVGPKHQRGRRQ
jgi:ribose/xylose/arabinose/galactoside ABC-type transport system permease subunit